MRAFKTLIAIVVVAGVMSPVAAFAQTATTSASVQATLQQIQTLEAQIKALQTQHQALLAQYKLLAEQQSSALKTLVQQLKEGSVGDQVSILQALLALDPSIYPEGRVTGYFGKLTADAVKRFQKKHGIDQAGNVGPKTLKKLQELYAGYDDDENNDDDDREHGKGREKLTICHKGQTITVSNASAYAHLRHGDTRGACGGGTTTMPPVTDTVAPILSSISVTAVGSTTATVNWATNENATGKVSYGIAADLSGAATLSTTTLSLAHTFALTGLTASTTYYYKVESKDAANNTGTSSVSSFNTTN
jgi:peptidoglycan hydrolase-like protein with peptidoglycan-binding domain